MTRVKLLRELRGAVKNLKRGASIRISADYANEIINHLTEGAKSQAVVNQMRRALAPKTPRKGAK